MRAGWAAVLAMSTPALADDAADRYDDCRATRQAIYARARGAADHVEYERVLRSAPDCEAAVPIPDLPPLRAIDAAADAFRPARLGAIDARWPASDPAPPPPAPIDPDPIVVEDDPPEPLPEPRTVTPRERPPHARARAPAPVGKPPLSGGRVVGEVLGGAAAATGGAFVGGLIGYEACASGCGGTTDDSGLGIGALMGGTLALGVGVWAVGDGDGQTGSVGASVGGGVAGLLGGVLLAKLTGSLVENTAYDSTARTIGDTLEALFLVGGPISGALVGFNLTRHYVGVPVVVPVRGGAAVSLGGSF